MAMAAALENSTAYSQAHAGSGRVARVDVIRDMAGAEAIWRKFETENTLSTPYQRYDFLKAWQKNVGEREGLSPFIVVALDGNHQPLSLLPLAIKRENGAQVARFLGGKHATFNMGIWRGDFAKSVTKGELDAVTNAITKYPDGVDVLALTQQPRTWFAVSNPMTAFGGQPSPNRCPLMTIDPAAESTTRISNSFRKRLKGKERKLKALPGYRYLLASTDAEITSLLDAFFVIKPLRMAAQKLPNVFADPGIREFIYDACLAKLTTGGHAIDIHALTCDAEVIAIFAGVADGHRYSMMFNTYTVSENSKYSPGLILLREIIDYYAGQNYTSLDLGIGSDEYKLLFCKSDEPIFDSFIPLTARGRFTAMGMSSLTHAKRLVKQNPALMHMAQMLRNAIHR